MDHDLTHATDDIAERVALAKARLSEKLSELTRRVESFRDKASVERARSVVVEHRWLALGGAAALGFLIGVTRPRVRALPAPGAAQKSIPRAVLMEIFVAAAGYATRKYLADRRS
jgi:ElaB/YqjD/DUF883 family membrane-anchored ribosome-binding protein